MSERMTLVEFLTARLDGRATKARAAMHGGEGRWTQVDPGRYPGLIEDERREIVVYDEGSPTEEQAAHIAENDPARVLREVESKRRIIGEHRDDGYGNCFGCGMNADEEMCNGIDDCPTLCALALPYADHPSFKEGWRP